MTTSENSVIFRRIGGHSHDGVTSSLLDTTKYSLFDFVPGTIAPSSTARGRIQNNNQNLIKNFIIQTVEERVLNPQGIAIRANTITAREIASGTVTANNLSANLVLINNIIRSNNFNGTFFANGALSTSGSTGWAISNTGVAVFSNAILRGEITANSGTIGGWTISSTQLRSNLSSVTGLILSSVGGVSAYDNSNSSDTYNVVLNSSGVFSTRNRSNQYSQFEILQTQNRHAEYFINRGVNLSYIKSHVIYTTDYISMAGRTSEAHTLGETILLQTGYSGNNPLGRIRVKTVNTSGVVLSYVNIGEGDGSVNASGYLSAGTSVSAGTYVYGTTYVDSGGTIGAGTSISAGTYVSAGTYIATAGYIRAGATNITHAGSISATNWFRSSGSSGWYNETFGGGIWMNDSSVVKVYGSKLFYSSHGMESGSYLYAATYTSADYYFMRSTATSDGDYIIRNSSDGSLYIKSSLTELKENIENINNSLSIINQLSPKSFNWKDYDENDDFSILTKKTYKTMGFLLEDVEKISPSLVTWRRNNDDGTIYPGYWKVDDFIALSIQGIKDLYIMIEDIKQQLIEIQKNEK